jgi:hypothetical protein
MYLVGQVVHHYERNTLVIYAGMYEIGDHVPKTLAHLPVQPNEYYLFGIERDGKICLLDDAVEGTTPLKDVMTNEIVVYDPERQKTNKQINRCLDKHQQWLDSGKLVLARSAAETAKQVEQLKRENAVVVDDDRCEKCDKPGGPCGFHAGVTVAQLCDEHREELGLVPSIRASNNP